jgi:hypothetical protein
VTKVKEFYLFYKKDGLPGRSQRRRLEQSDTTTLDTLVTLAHFRHLTIIPIQAKQSNFQIAISRGLKIGTKDIHSNFMPGYT